MLKQTIGYAVLLTATLCQSVAAATLCVDSKNPACFTTIGTAVTAASSGDIVQVQTGTYPEDVVIAKTLSLIGADEGTTVIDATGKSNGIFVNGMGLASSLPGVVISGFTVKNANFEGILIANATGATVTGNKVVNNNQSLNIAAGTCPGIPLFEANEGNNCGEGIHLMAVDNSTIAKNDVEYNSGGINISDETGPAFHNLITGNLLANNPYDCGITLASHPGLSTAAFGVYNNTISQNTSTANGLLLPSADQGTGLLLPSDAGAGIGIFAPSPGARNSGNVVIGNQVSYNGRPGITMHNHFGGVGGTAVNMNDNMIVGNVITRNAADTADAATPGPAGINIYSVVLVTGTVVSQNSVNQEAVDFVFNVPFSNVELHLNDFNDAAIGVENIGTGAVNATQNWWNCTAGPNTSGCGAAIGSNVTTAPALSRPF